MAARLNPAHDAATREKIKTSQLVNRLQGYALLETDGKTGAVIEIDPGRLKAIEILLRKSLPDLANVQISGDPEKPMTMTLRWGNPEPKLIAGPEIGSAKLPDMLNEGPAAGIVADLRKALDE